MAQELTQKELDAIGKKAFAEIYNACKLEGIDYTTLPKSAQSAMLSCFIAGVKYVKEEIMKPIDERSVSTEGF